MKQWLNQRLKLLAILAGLLVIIQVINSLTGYSLNRFGIIPRSLEGLIGIPLSPFIHSSWGHLLSNLPPLLILSAVLLHREIREYLLASLFIIITGGLAVWLVGRYAIHVGASGWIFGLWGLLIAQGYFRRKLSDIIITVLVLFYFGAMASGLLPVHQYISTESHIAGAISGIFYAWWVNRRKKSALSPTES
ncbi:rhomboid family intramembrane serine protease [Providencia stuartii]|uniref:Peptidase, S54 family n=1 Tax=Providencia stuartii ATCC 25827 TaxID=471874 RepID=A0AA86YPD0_PROST|nr:MULTISPECIES: rhomboid family intramembrane serine protease [Providencia]APG51891.1 rhomboid family intramembrane serine protease [Providencia stuartii]AVL41868.1 rhomboid family intramembrane serine protease [Providencia stuartii]EDU61506.1 peptidase, S54 family [Providencia stuartii ATCC 25827]EMD1718222.1 rhomboid family intramembrane serine protease [Providencia stuartii]KNZ84010.1 membrane protein [Providencia stuartii]